MSGNSVLEKIKAAKDLGEIRVTMSDWGVDLLLIEPSRKDILALQTECGIEVDVEKKALVKGDAEMFGLKCMVMMVHDTDRNKVFESVEQAEEVLDGKSSKSYLKLVEACQQLIKGPDVVAIKEAKGNSDGTQS